MRWHFNLGLHKLESNQTVQRTPHLLKTQVGRCCFGRIKFQKHAQQKICLYLCWIRISTNNLWSGWKDSCCFLSTVGGSESLQSHRKYNEDGRNHSHCRAP